MIDCLGLKVSGAMATAVLRGGHAFLRFSHAHPGRLVWAWRPQLCQFAQLLGPPTSGKSWTGASDAAIIVRGQRHRRHLKKTRPQPAATNMSAEMESLMRAALMFGAIFALAAIVLEVGRRLRSRAVKDKLARHEMMANFRELYERGGLSDEEFRTIKAKLAAELKAELSDSGGKG